MKNLQNFKDQLYLYTITKTANCFLLFTKTDNSDRGSMIGIGTECGFLGAVMANYYCGLVGSYSVNPPPTIIESYI